MRTSRLNNQRVNIWKLLLNHVYECCGSSKETLVYWRIPLCLLCHYKLCDWVCVFGSVHICVWQWKCVFDLTGLLELMPFPAQPKTHSEPCCGECTLHRRMLTPPTAKAWRNFSPYVALILQFVGVAFQSRAVSNDSFKESKTKHIIKN